MLVNFKNFHIGYNLKPLKLVFQNLFDFKKYRTDISTPIIISKKPNIKLNITKIEKQIYLNLHIPQDEPSFLNNQKKKKKNWLKTKFLKKIHKKKTKNNQKLKNKKKTTNLK